jgi:hypothetical protein
MTRAAVYSRNLPQVLEETPWQYCGLKEYATRQDGAWVDVTGYLIQYRRKPYLEYLSKLRLFRLAEDLVVNRYFAHVLNEEASDLASLLQLPKQYVRMAQEINPDLDELGILQKIIQSGIQVNADIFRRIMDSYSHNLDDVLRNTRHASWNRIEGYLENNRAVDKDFSYVVRLWIDYVGFCEKLNYDMYNDFVLFPRHLKQAHDDTMKRYNRMKKENQRKLLDTMSDRITDALTQAQKQFSLALGGLIVKAPQNLNEIVQEGHALRHCVGSYTDSVFEGKTTILFLRRAGNPEKSFFTIEIKKGAVVQCRGKNNCAQTDEVKKFLAAWEKKCLRRETS